MFSEYLKKFHGENPDYRKKQYEKRKEKVAEYDKKRYAENKDYYKEQYKKWCEKHPDYFQKYYRENKDRILESKGYNGGWKKIRRKSLEYSRMYYEKNKEKVSEYGKKRYEKNKKIHLNKISPSAVHLKTNRGTLCTVQLNVSGVTFGFSYLFHSFGRLIIIT